MTIIIDLSWRLVVKTLVESLIVIELEISIQALFQSYHSGVIPEINIFILDGSPQSFNEDVVKHTTVGPPTAEESTAAIHADLHLSGFQAFCETM